MKCVCCLVRALQSKYFFQKSELTMEVGGRVQVTLENKLENSPKIVLY